LIRFAPSSKLSVLEEKLAEPLMTILGENVQEFIPYVFQLLAALLEKNPTGALSEYYQNLIAPVLTGSLWESRGNVPALVRLLTALIPRGIESILKNNQLEPILGIFQKLVSSKVHESQAFELIECVIANTPLTSIEPYFVTILQLMLQRLSNMKTEVFSQRFISFYHFVSARQDKGLGADFFINVTDRVQHE
jgi:exportin-2 (importin alpha re-exporter)